MKAGTAVIVGAGALGAGLLGLWFARQPKGSPPGSPTITLTPAPPGYPAGSITVNVTGTVGDSYTVYINTTQGLSGAVALNSGMLPDTFVAQVNTNYPYVAVEDTVTNLTSRWIPFVAPGMGQPCSSTNPCLTGYSCVNGYCTACSGSCSTPGDCTCLGPGFTGCENGQCYIPVIQAINLSTSSALITANIYKSQQCCEYAAGASVTTCGTCYQGANNMCGAGRPTAGKAASFVVSILDQYGNPYVGAAVSVSAAFATGFSGCWYPVGASSGTATELTDTNGDATFNVNPVHLPSSLASLLGIPDCTSTNCVPLIGICYCNGGASTSLSPLQESGVPAGQVNVSIAGISQRSALIVEMLPYGQCLYLGQTIPALSGGCQGACP